MDVTVTTDTQVAAVVNELLSVLRRERPGVGQAALLALLGGMIGGDLLHVMDPLREGYTSAVFGPDWH